jgi:predicted ATP-grasp superfamily ATP-dependent carboligase
LRPAVILAQGTGSLGAARVLGRRGVPVIAVLWDPVTPIRHSRYARRIVEVPPGTAAEREAYLLRLLTSLGEDRPVLLASSDRLIEFIARHRAELAPHFALCAPSFALIEVLNDKAREVGLIASLGFSVPKTLAPVPPSADEIEARLGLPVIIKPRSFQHLSLIAGKNVVIRDRAALGAFCREHAGRFHGLIAQEVIPGPDDTNWVCSGTFDHAHEMLDCTVKRKLRMAPAHFGVATHAVSASNPVVLDLARRLGKALRYSGSFGIEWHWDPRDGTYKYIELNPRFPLTIEFDDFCGLPTVWHTYRIAADERATYEPGVQRDGCIFLDPVDDMKARLADGERVWSILADYLRMMPRRHAGLYFAWDDPRPGVWMTWRVLKSGIQRMLRRRAPRRFTEARPT